MLLREVDMKKIKNFFRGAVVLLITATIIFSSVAIANTIKTESIETHTIVNEGYYEGNTRGVVLWDNGMHYNGMFAAQWDNLIALDPLPADDFHFEENTVITDVHWIGGYWNPGEDGDFDWNVSFYNDRGDGNAPGAKIFQQVFPNAAVHETFIEDTPGGSKIFSYWVDLADPIPFTGCEKYWISIQGVGNYAPQSGWAYHLIPIVLHEAVFKSVYFGFPDWVDSVEVFGNPGDMCFQLTGDGEPAVADLGCDGDLMWDNVPPGGMVNGTFVVMNVGDIGSMLEWEVLSTPTWGLNWTFIPDGGFVGTTIPEEVFVEVTAPNKKNKKFTGEIVLVNSNNAADTCIINIILKTPRSKMAYNPLFLRFLEQFPNAFPMLRQLLGL